MCQIPTSSLSVSPFSSLCLLLHTRLHWKPSPSLHQPPSTHPCPLLSIVPAAISHKITSSTASQVKRTHIRLIWFLITCFYISCCSCFCCHFFYLIALIPLHVSQTNFKIFYVQCNDLSAHTFIIINDAVRLIVAINVLSSKKCHALYEENAQTAIGRFDVTQHAAAASQQNAKKKPT